MMTFDEIRQMLPHAYPMVLLDRVEELAVGERIVALKNVSGNEWMFPGHFPTHAIYPGVLLLESMAQASILLLKASYPDVTGKFFIVGARSRWIKPVVPGDQVRFECQPEKIVSTGGLVDAKATVGPDLVARSSLTFAVR